MTGTAFAFNWDVAGDPSYTARQLRQMMVAPFVAMGSSARPLGAKSGIRVGTPSSIASITGTGPYSYAVQPFVGVIDAEPNAAAAPYTYCFAAAETGSIDPAGSVLRVDSLDVVLSDEDEGDSSATRTVQLVRTPGASTGSLPPAAPARSHHLAYINVPTSGAPTIQWAPEWSGDPGEWTFNTTAERDAYVLKIGSVNVPVNQRATILADTTAANNGDWVWSGSTWLPMGTAYQVGAFTPTGIYAAGTPTPQATRVGNRVFLEGVVTSSSATFATNTVYTVGSIPAAFAPSSTRSFLAFVSSGNVVGYITVNSAGTISLVLITAGFTGALSLVLDGHNWRM